MQSEKVTKYDLVEAIYEDTEHEKKIIQAVLESFFKQVKDSLIKKKTIELRGFGTFELRLRKGKKSARNPKTGEQVSVAPHYVAAFRSGRDLKNSLWEIPIPKD